MGSLSCDFCDLNDIFFVLLIYLLITDYRIYSLYVPLLYYVHVLRSL